MTSLPARALAIGLSMSLALAIPTVATADHGGSAAQQAAAEIQAARDRADAAAQALFDKESEIDQLDVAIADAEVELARIEDEADEMRRGLEQQAVRQFVGAGPTSFPLLIDLEHANDSLSAGMYNAVATETINVDLDDFDAVMKDVEQQRSSLERQRAAADDATRTYAALRDTAEAEIVRLGEIEAQRLQDEAVQHELDALRERERLAELQRQAAAEPPTTTATTPAPAADTAIDAGAITDESDDGTDTATTAAPVESDPSPAPATTSAPEAPSTTAAPAPAPAPEPSSSEPAPTVPVPVPDVGSGLACPVDGPRSFADTWGAARSGGRSHEGVDIMAPAGTPLVAMEAGRVEFNTNTLGGNTLRLYGNSGTRYYYAHLSAWEGSNRTVAKGEVIGYVGMTGNTSANHLHLQVHPGGGAAVNPYPFARAACG
jgi:peptidoglycan LD-endopeptidase LytH